MTAAAIEAPETDASTAPPELIPGMLPTGASSGERHLRRRPDPKPLTEAEQAAEDACQWCVNVKTVGWIGQSDVSHCKVCHVAWKRPSRTAHCVVCHATFTSGDVADSHLRAGTCCDPATMEGTEGQLAFAGVENKYGVLIYRRQGTEADRERLRLIRTSGGVATDELDDEGDDDTDDE